MNHSPDAQWLNICQLDDISLLNTAECYGLTADDGETREEILQTLRTFMFFDLELDP